MPGADESALRLAFRAWLDENLPEDWRFRSHGATDASVQQMRVGIGERLGWAGWLSLSWPETYGGAGKPASDRIMVLEELVRAGAPEPMNANALGIFAPTLMRFGTADQCRAHLAPMLTHEALWCQGFSEPDAGSDLAGIRTRGVVVGDEIVITGQKVWTSYAHLADYCYLLLRTDASSRAHEGLSLVMVPMRQPAITVRPLRNIAGTEEFCEVFFDGAVAPTDNIVGARGEGWKQAMFALAQERSVGLAQRSMQLTGEFERLAELCEREARSGNLSASDNLFNGPLVDAFVMARAVDATVRRALEMDGAGGDVGTIAPVAKVAWSEGHQRQTALALDVLGPRAVMTDGAESRWWTASLFSRAETIYGGTSQIQRNLLARSLGLPRGLGRRVD